MQKKLKKFLWINLILSILPLALSILISLGVLVLCMLGENETNIDGYQSMAVFLIWIIAYIPIWSIAVLFYVVLEIMLLIFIIKALNAGDRKREIISANRIANTYSYIVLVLVVIHGIFVSIAFFSLTTMCKGLLWSVVISFVGIVFYGIEIAFGASTIMHGTYISQYKSIN